MSQFARKHAPAPRSMPIAPAHHAASPPEARHRAPAASAPAQVNVRESAGGYDFSRVRALPRASDFQQGGAAAGPENETTEAALDQQVPPPPVLGPVGGGGATGVGGGGGAPAPVPAPVPAPAPAPATLGSPTATIGTRVRAASTPTAMAPDRIPPNVDFPVSIAIANLRIPMRDVDIAVDGSGGTNGIVTVNGAATTTMGASGTVQLRGTAQTAPGSAGNLRLVVRWAGTQLAVGNSFSVAAIPQDMALSGHTPLTGATRGMVVTQTWSSDSGRLADLDEAQISEQVQYILSTGVFSGLGATNSGYIGANGGSLTDTHSTPVAALTGPGMRVANQTEMFLDNRTGVRDIPMRNSGFTIGRVVLPIPTATGVRMHITTTKAGAAVTANGIASAAGAGRESEPQLV
ncbi:hypothetical protein [Pendulispora albinea]|uniref:Minor tail protein n=1 Tax=Pendulispora albinea TaxID=2741071 RepID=A0ABZ2MAV4_9BACT